MIKKTFVLNKRQSFIALAVAVHSVNRIKCNNHKGLKPLLVYVVAVLTSFQLALSNLLAMFMSTTVIVIAYFISRYEHFLHYCQGSVVHVPSIRPPATNKGEGKNVQIAGTGLIDLLMESPFSQC